MTNRMMIDLETLSTHEDAAVVAIGAVVFNDSEILASLYYPLSFTNLTGHIDPATVAWWMEQSKEAQQMTFSPNNRVQPFIAGDAIVAAARNHNCTTIWANDPHFDVVILQNWWHRYDRPHFPQAGRLIEPAITAPWPFKYNQPRSYRTLVELAKKHGFTDQMYDNAKGMYVKHCAVDDAASQARVVIACEQYLDHLVTDKTVAAPGLHSWRNGLPV